MRTGRPTPALSLTTAERETLQNWSRRPKSAQALALRARMILLCAEGATNTRVAEQIQVRTQTVGKCGSVLWTGGWTACWMNRVPVRRAK